MSYAITSGGIFLNDVLWRMQDEPEDVWSFKEEVRVKLLYDWPFIAHQFVLATSLLRPTSSNFIFQLNTCGYKSLCNILSGERMGLSITIAAGPGQRSHSQVRVPRDSWPHSAVSDSRLPQPGGPGPRIYIPHEQGRPVIPPGIGFPFRRLLRLAGLR
jgi:hypothetical protein